MGWFGGAVQGWVMMTLSMIDEGSYVSEDSLSFCEGPRSILSILSIVYQPPSCSTYPGVQGC